MSQVAINHFDTQFGSKYTPPISHLDLKAVLLSFWGVINTSYLSSPYYMFYFIFVFLPDSAPTLSLSTLFPSPPLSLPFSLLLPSLICFPKWFISAAQPSNLNWYNDTAVDSMYVCKFLLLSHLISSLSLSLIFFCFCPLHLLLIFSCLVSLVHLV